jgi:hypothetical protein
VRSALQFLPPLKATLLSLALIGLAASCGPSGGIKPITETREVKGPRGPVPVTASSADRFGYGEANRAMRPEPQGAPLEWDAPAGWQDRSGSGMRVADFAVGSKGEAECYIIVLQGDGGGLAANVNRWRAQMGQEALSEETIGALPQLEVLGRAATLVEIVGNYAGMSGEPQPGFMMLALVCELADSSVFVKMVGPEATVRAEAEPFRAFCQSLRFAVDGES